jgi:hypothetical protein
MSIIVLKASCLGSVSTICNSYLNSLTEVK